MPSRTLEDKVEELTKITAAQAQEIRQVREKIDELVRAREETVKAIGELKNVTVRLDQQIVELYRWKEELGSLTDLKTELAILRRDVDKLEHTKEEWSRRLWAVAGPVLG